MGRSIQLAKAVQEIVASTRGRRKRGEGFPFFLIAGAGVAAPSVPLASGIEQLCRERIRADGGEPPAKPLESALERYALLFESAFPQAEDRQEFLQDLIKGRPISPASFRLAHLLGELELTNLVFTPNFDQMLSRACRLLGYDAVVCDHPKTTARVRLESSELRQIVHVHGTHWFYDCCNLGGEISDQARSDPTDGVSMGQLLDRVLAQRSPIVVGYSGWEGDVIMTALRRRLRINTLPRNVYWFCYRQADAEALPQWLRAHGSVRWVVPADVSGPRVAAAPASAAAGTGVLAQQNRPVTDSFDEPVLPAQQVFGALIRALELKAPRLTLEPLEFFSDQISTDLPEEQDDEQDLYRLSQVRRRVREGAQLERDKREREVKIRRIEASLEKVDDALRRADYRAAAKAAQAVKLKNLDGSDQRTRLDEALEALYQGAPEDEAEAALAACELRLELVALAREARDAPSLTLNVREAKAIHGKGYCYGVLRRYEEAQQAFDEVARRFGTSADPELRLAVAKATFSKGVLLRDAGQPQAALEVLARVREDFGRVEASAVAEYVAKATVSEGAILNAEKRTDEAVSVYGKVVELYGDRSEPELRRQVAGALFNQGIALGDAGRSREAVASYEEVRRRFPDLEDSRIQEVVAMAMVNQATVLASLEETPDSALAVSDEVIDRFGSSPSRELQEQVLRAHFIKALLLHSAGDVERLEVEVKSLRAKAGESPRPHIQRLLDMVEEVLAKPAGGDAGDEVRSEGADGIGA